MDVNKIRFLLRQKRELWRPIKGYEELYCVSDKGRIKRKGGRILTASFNAQKYHHVSLSKNNEKKTQRVHRLVASAFIPNPENKLFVNHKDGNKINNRVDNLEWCTLQENFDHAVKNGLTARGVRQHSSKLTDEKVYEMRKLHKRGATATELSKIYGVGLSNTCDVLKGKTWKHIRF